VHTQSLCALAALAALAAWAPGAPATAAAALPGAACVPVVADDVPPKPDDEKKNEVTLWVLDAKGKG